MDGAGNVTDFKTEAQKADAYRVKCAPLLEAFAALMNEAKRDGFQLSFTMTADQFGRFVAPPVSIVKPL